jgi:hypothetical protein
MPNHIDRAVVSDIDADVYCPEWWNRIFLNQVNDQFEFKPCCMYRGMLSERASDSTSIYQKYTNIIEPLREQNRQGIRDVGCAQCWETEARGQTSGRQWKIVEQGHQTVDVNTHLDLNLSNLCNLSCAICGPWNSSTWAAKTTNKLYPVGNQYQKSRPAIDDPELFRRLRSIQLQGGETFMDPNYSLFFENMGRYRDYSDLTVTVFTNGTTRPSDRFLKILNSCAEVKVFFSIDDIDQRFEYQRSGANWPSVVHTIHWFQNNTGPQWHFNFNPTYSLLNIFYLPELLSFFQTEFPKMSVFLNQFNNQPGLLAQCEATRMTSHVRDVILDRTQNIPQLNFLPGYISIAPDPWAPFLNYVSMYDEMIGQSYADTHAEFYQLITQ